MSWGYLCLALLLFVAGGLLIGFAVYDGGAAAWAMAILVPMLGVLVMAARMLRESRPRKVKPESSVEWRETAAPPLGQ
ncbi:MAG: hypothetical protein MUQ26_01275, partial [Armatimonadetes bacterium]|nr:hypothetical protein [Armatimonadota bacterium]